MYRGERVMYERQTLGTPSPRNRDMSAYRAPCRVGLLGARGGEAEGRGHGQEGRRRGQREGGRVRQRVRREYGSTGAPPESLPFCGTAVRRTATALMTYRAREGGPGAGRPG